MERIISFPFFFDYRIYELTIISDKPLIETDKQQL